jgi:hypothetical protein
MRLAIQRSIAVETPRGWRIAKDKSSHKIDVVVALGMAAHGAVQAGGSSFDSSYRWAVAGAPGFDGQGQVAQQPQQRSIWEHPSLAGFTFYGRPF